MPSLNELLLRQSQIRDGGGLRRLFDRRPEASPPRGPVAQQEYGDPSDLPLESRFSDLFEGDPRIFEGIRQRYERARGGRSRAVQLGLQARGGDVPGGYGVASVLSELGGQSDLSRELGEANLSEAQRGRSFREDYSRRLQEFLRGEQTGRREFGERETTRLGQQEFEVERAKLESGLAERRIKKERRRNPISLGFGPVKVAFAHGGIATRPTMALLGEEEPEAVIPLSRLLGGRDLIGARQRMGRLGSMDLPGAADDGDPSTLPLPPTPYAEPGPARPQGILERIGELSRLIQIEVGDDAPGVLKALALGAGGVAAIGESRLKRREGERGRATEAVERMNKRQEQLYGKQLDIAGRAPVQMVQLPDGTYVPVRSSPGGLEIERRNPSIRRPVRPAAQKAPKSEAEVGRLVGDVVSRLNSVKTEQEIDAIAVSVKGVHLSSGQLARMKAAADAAYARVANASPY